jgi:hypothetical protein
MSQHKNLWVWPTTHNQTHENHLPKRFGQLKELNNIARESTQNTRDAWNLKHPDTAPSADDCAVIRFSIGETDKDLSKYFSGLLEARNKLAQKDGARHGNKYSDTPDFTKTDWLLVQDVNTMGIQGSIDKRDSDFWSFFLNWGKSNKAIQGAANSGSKGVGRITFPLYSKLGCIFALTKREDGIYLGGYALLNSFVDAENNKTHDSYAIFADQPSSNGNGTWQLHDKSLTKDFIKDFKIPSFKFNNKDSLGTAVIIPFPRDDGASVDESYNQIKAALIETYAPLIIRGEMKPKVGKEEINDQNIARIAGQVTEYFDNKEFKNCAEEYIDFLRTATYENEIKEYEAVFELNDYCDFDPEKISEDDNYKINQALEDGEVVNLKIKFPIFKNGNRLESFIEACLKKPNEENTGYESYFRNGMSMVKQGKVLNNKFHAALFCREPEIAKYLNVFEDEGHTMWVMGEGQKYEAAEVFKYDREFFVRPVKLCRDIFSHLRKLVVDSKTEVDEVTLAKFFEIPEEQESSDKPKMPKIERKKKLDVAVSQSSSGFTISSKDQSILPKKIEIRMTYKSHPLLTKVPYKPEQMNLNSVQIVSKSCEYNISDELNNAGKPLSKLIKIYVFDKDFKFGISKWEIKKEPILNFKFEK